MSEDRFSEDTKIRTGRPGFSWDAEGRKKAVLLFRQKLRRDPIEFDHEFIMKPQSIANRAAVASSIPPVRHKGEDESGRSARRITDHEREAIRKHKEEE